MERGHDKAVLADVVRILSDLTGSDDGRVVSSDVVVSGRQKFVVEPLSSSDLAAVKRGLERIASRKIGEKRTPLLVVPFMGEVGASACQAAGISWMDLSGNAHIAAPGLHVHVEGKPNRFKRRGRQSGLFAPKSSRIVRWLLMSEVSRRPLTQREIARRTEMDEGFTSRILRGLEDAGLISRDPGSGAIRVVDYDTLLDAWHQAYDFGAHTIIRAHIAARSGTELMQQFASALDDRKIEYAMTGLGAAWLLSRFAAFRIATFYLREPPREALLADLDAREVDRGENLWLVLPNDEGVFDNAGRGQEIVCVDPVQIYVDLKGHPERAKEAAAQLRYQTRIARELRAGEKIETVLVRYRENGVTRESVEFIQRMITNGVKYFPQQRGRGD